MKKYCTGAGFTVNFVEPYPEWNEMVFYRWGYARVTAVDANTLEWKWINGIDNEMYDRVKITQNLTDSWELPESTSTSSDQSDDDDMPAGVMAAIYAAAAIGISVVSIGAYVLISKQFYKENSDDHEMSTKLV